MERDRAFEGIQFLKQVFQLNDDPHVKASRIRFFLRQAYTLNLLFYYIQYSELLRMLEKGVARQPAWSKAMANVTHKYECYYASFREQIESGGNRMNRSYYDEIKQELLKLPNIPVFTKSAPTPEDSLESLIHLLQDDVKKGNRVTFKILQELQARLDELSANESGNELLKTAAADSQKQLHKLTALLLDVFDLVDLVYTSSLSMGDATWSQELQKVVDKALYLLRDYGLEEIRVEGQMIDGETMEGIGTISPEELDVPLEKYQVYKVHQRGFRNLHTGELIRKCKVTTVY